MRWRGVRCDHAPLLAELQALKAENARLKAENGRLKAENGRLHAHVGRLHARLATYQILHWMHAAIIRRDRQVEAEQQRAERFKDITEEPTAVYSTEVFWTARPGKGNI